MFPDPRACWRPVETLFDHVDAGATRDELPRQFLMVTREQVLTVLESAKCTAVCESMPA